MNTYNTTPCCVVCAVHRESLAACGYTDQFIRSCQRITASTNQCQTRRGFVTLPYIQGVSERITRTLNQFNINVAYKPVTTYQQE